MLRPILGTNYKYRYTYGFLIFKKVFPAKEPTSTAALFLNPFDSMKFRVEIKRKRENLKLIAIQFLDKIPSTHPLSDGGSQSSCYTQTSKKSCPLLPQIRKKIQRERGRKDRVRKKDRKAASSTSSC